jgi:hypothetical protein
MPQTATAILNRRRRVGFVAERGTPRKGFGIYVDANTMAPLDSLGVILQAISIASLASYLNGYFGRLCAAVAMSERLSAPARVVLSKRI